MNFIQGSVNFYVSLDWLTAWKTLNIIIFCQVNEYVFYNFKNILCFSLKCAKEIRNNQMLPSDEHIVRMFSAWMEDNQVYLLLEWCKHTLDTYGKSKFPLPNDELWDILRQTAQVRLILFSTTKFSFLSCACECLN